MKNVHRHISNINYWQADILSAYDYSPFGVMLSGRDFAVDSTYKYGFNGQERDDQVSGDGNSYTAEFWQYSSRLARRWNIDPMTSIYTWQSPYSTFNNNPIFYADPLGLEGEPPYTPEGAPGAPEEGENYTDTDGRSWQWGTDNKGVSAWARYDGRLESVTVYPADVKKSMQKEYERIEGNRNSLMGQFFGNMTAWGRNPFEDQLKKNPNHPMSEAWSYNRAKADAARNIVIGTMTAGVTIPFAVTGAVTTAPVWTSYLMMGTNYTLNMARAYHTTFGVNGGYASIAQNIFNQSITQYVANGNVSFGNYDLLSIGTSGFLRADAGLLLQTTQGASGIFVQFTFNDGFGGALIEKKSGMYVATSLMMSTLTPLLNKTPVFPSLINEAVPAFGQGVIDRFEKQSNK